MTMDFCDHLGSATESRNRQVPWMNNEVDILFLNYFRDVHRFSKGSRIRLETYITAMAGVVRGMDSGW